MTGRDERGSALLMAIGFILVIAAMGLAVSVAGRTETLVAAGFRQGREELYAAEGALGLAFGELAAIPDWNLVLSGAATASFTDGPPAGGRTLPGGDTITLCCDAASLTGTVQQRALGGRNWGDDTPQWRIFAWGPVAAWLGGGRVDSPHYVAVWVADDPEDGDGNPGTDANGTLVLHAQALGPLGGRRILEASVRRQVLGEEALPGPGLRLLSWREIRW